jgi:hypothetical protein
LSTSRRFTELRPPPNPDDLPADLRRQMEQPVPTKMTDLEMAALNGELENIPDPSKVEAVQTVEQKPSEIIRDKVDVEASIQDRAIKAVQDLQSDWSSLQVIQLTKLARLDKFDLLFDDEKVKRFNRVGMNVEKDEKIKDLQNEYENKLYLEGKNEGTEISKRELRLIRKLIIKLGLNYLEDNETRKKITKEEANHVICEMNTGDRCKFNQIIDSCIYRTVHEIADPKV